MTTILTLHGQGRISTYHTDTIRIPSRGDESNIRQQLRKWEAENPPTILSFRPPGDDPAAPVNVLTSSQNPQAYQQRVLSAHDHVTPRLEGGELVDIGNAVSGLQPGDMIEVTSDAWRIPLLAVCLGTFNGYDHFYTDSGKWFATRDIYTRFVVKGFILDPGELQPVIDAIPTTVGEARILDEFASLNVGPTRDIGQFLRARMHEFQETARRHNHTYSESLNRAHALAGREEKLMTLEEIASAVLPSTAARQEGEYAFPMTLLYAVHCSVCMYHQLIFRPLQQTNRRYHTFLYAVSSEQDTALLHDIENTLRAVLDGPRHASAAPTLQGGVAVRFKMFVQRAQQAIDRSRRSREWSPCGMLGPDQKSLGEATFKWGPDDMRYITFMQQWAASGRITRGSRLHWIGAAILRATERYTQAEYLDCAAGWTFLQEIGWTTPWDIPSRHSLRLPGVAPHGSNTEATPAKEPVMGPDLLASIRTDFKDATVYCIDSEKAEDIDDGISLERADKQGEYWINIHVADPASRIAPNSPLAKQAAAKAQTCYLVGFVDPMFQAEAVRESFSLGPERPSLTFSARVNEAGDILDYKVSPHVLKDVVYMTPDDAMAVVGDGLDTLSSFSTPGDHFEVGKPPSSPPPPTRKMTKPDELSEKQASDIKILNRLAKALHEVRLRNGCVPTYLPRVRAEVSLEHTSMTTLENGFVHCTGDPYIRVAYDPSVGMPLVSSIMQLAGNVAARWCHDRKIPVPYRVQVSSEQNAQALKEFTQTVLYPKLLAGQPPTDDDMRVFRNLSGGFSMATKPSFNISVGMDMYTKATSPLRRYCDLLVHWQIEAALLEESLRESSAKSEKKQKPQKRGSSHSLLPFSREMLNQKIIPHLSIRERYSNRLSNIDGNKTWILQALARAWRFGEGKEQLPKTFSFTVQRIEEGSKLWGSLDWFDQWCMVPLRGLGGVLSTIADVKVGDKFIVELAEVDVYNGYITCQLLEKAGN